MYFEKFNFLLILLFIFLFWIWLFYFYKNFMKKNKLIPTILLLISFFLVIINIFWIKTSINLWNNSIKWWKILFIMDVSKSMNTIDINKWNKLISRLNFSKNIIKDFIINNPQNKNSLAIFAWEMLEILPFTSDSSIFIKILNWLNSNNISKNWSELVWVFNSILDFFPEEENWTVVIFTDGWDDKIELLKNEIDNINLKKINIIIVWVWSLKWNYIPNWYDIWWNIIFKTYKWEKIISKLNNENLDKISDNFNFKYFVLNDIKKQKELENEILSIIDKNNIINNENNNNYLTRFFILLSLIFFILFLIFDNFIWKK